MLDDPGTGRELIGLSSLSAGKRPIRRDCSSSAVPRRSGSLATSTGHDIAAQPAKLAINRNAARLARPETGVVMKIPLNSDLKSALLATAIATLLASPAFAETVTIRFVQTNDLDRMEEDDGRGGFARVAAVRRGRARRRPDALRPFRRHHLAVAALGHRQGRAPDRHHEPDGHRHHGARQSRVRLRAGCVPLPHGEVKFPIVSSNIREADGSQPANTIDEKMVEIEGIKIGFYGLTTEETPVARDDRRHDLRLQRRHRRAPRVRRCARRAPTSSSRSSTRRSRST